MAAKPVIEYDSIPPSKRLRILQKMTALLEGINPTNTYTHPEEGVVPYPLDLRKNVFRGRLTVSNEEAQDALSLLENPRPLDASEVGWDKLLRVGDWIILLQGWPRDNIKNPSDPAYKLAALCEARLSRIAEVDSRGDPVYPGDYLLGVDSEGHEEIERLSIGQSVVRPPSDTNSRLAMFYIPLVVRFASTPSKPFL